MKNNKSGMKSFWEKYKHSIIVACIILLIIVCVVMLRKFFDTKKTYTVVNGYVEKVSDTVAYALKKEGIVDSKTTTPTIPVVDQGKRAYKNQIIAIYKTNKYSEYINKIDELDKQIQSLVKDLPETYSSDITDIDNQISKIAMDTNRVTSYVKMQEYKNKLDELAYKKVVIIGELSPAGSKIRELIENRENVESESKNLSDNIKANMSGVVTYKIDGLEDIIDFNKVLNYDISKFDSIINSYSKNNINNFGIKIVDNYKAYLFVKEPRGENDQYIKVGRTYDIKFTDKNNINVKANIVSNIQNEEYNYLLFEINNGIENLVDIRSIGAEIIWTKVTRNNSANAFY